jgi:hypothetical protein
VSRARAVVIAAATLTTLIASLAPTGCAQNAVLELELDLPQSPSPATTRYAVVRVVTGDVSFDEEWQGDPQLPPFALDPSAKTVQRVSLDGSSDVESAKVRVKVRFCRDPNCAAIGDDTAPEVRLQLARAFYAGKRTSYAWSIPCVPNVAGQTDTPVCATAQRGETDVTKCEVAGCRSGVARSYCVGDKHFCEE